MKPTASKLHLFEQCAGVGALPAVRTVSTDDQAAGTGRHRFLERAAQVGRDEALSEIAADAPWRATCEGIDLSEIPTGGATRSATPTTASSTRPASWASTSRGTTR